MALTSFSETFHCCTKRGLIRKSFIHRSTEKVETMVAWPCLADETNSVIAQRQKWIPNQISAMKWIFAYCQLIKESSHVYPCVMTSGFQRAWCLLSTICNSTNCNVNFSFSVHVSRTMPGAKGWWGHKLVPLALAHCPWVCWRRLCHLARGMISLIHSL